MRRLATLIIFSVILFSTVLTGFSIYSEGSDNLDSSTIKASNVIRINSNKDFENYGFEGSGTEDDPYVIEGLEINANGAGAGIYIGNTTVHFIIVKSKIYNAAYHSKPYFPGAGIVLYNATNGTIERNLIIENSKYGIYSYLSYHNSIDSNTINNNRYGIYLYYGKNYKIGNNTITANSYYGVYSWYGYNDVINSNTVRDNKYGVFLYANRFITIVENTFYHNGLIIRGFDLSHWNTHIIKENTVNGKEIGYFTNTSIPNIYGDFGELIIANCSDSTIRKVDLSSGDVGIILAYSNNIVIKNSIISNNSWGGIYSYKTSNMNIQNNSIIDNNAIAIFIWYGENNIIDNNTISNNKNIGIYLTSNSYNIVKYNKIINNSDGINIYSSNYNNIENNNVRYNKNYGISIKTTRENTVKNNIVWKNYNDGVYLRYSYYGKIIDNTIVKNLGYGIHLHYGEGNFIYNNTLYYNNGAGDNYNGSNIQGYDSSTKNYWNSTSGFGNYWHEWANNNDTNDQNNDGIVDWPYSIAGSGGVFDHYPLKNPTTTPRIKPTPPRELKMKNGTEYVNLTWKTPVGNGTSQITSYKIYRNGSFIDTVPATQLWYNDTNVTPGETYTYYVTAVNSVGESDPSNEVQATIEVEVPEFSMLLIIALLLIAIIIKRKT